MSHLEAAVFPNQVQLLLSVFTGVIEGVDENENPSSPPGAMAM